MKLEKTTTGLIIRQPSHEIKKKCLQYFSLNKPLREYFIYSGNDPDNKPIFGKEKDVIYISSGFLSIKDRVIESLSAKDIPIIEGKHVSIKMNRQPRSKLQEDCITKLTTSKSNKITVELKPGTGKAQPLSTKIPTPTGYTLLGDIKIGDYVFDRMGNPTCVLGVYDQGVMKVYKVTFSDGRISYCTAEHLWSVNINDDTDQYYVLQLQSIMENPDTKYSIQISQPVKYPIRSVPINPWVLGCFIGGGHLTLQNLCITSDTGALPHKIANIYGWDVKKHSIKNLYYFNHKSGIPVKTKSFFKDLPGIYGNILKNIIIPECYIYNDIDIRSEILRGMVGSGFNPFQRNDFDDDCVIVEQFKQLSYSLGFIDPSKPKPQTASITNIEYDHDEECRCIRVDNDESLYLTEDYVVTHNTFISLYSISKLGLKTLITTPTSLLKNQWIENLIELGVDKDDIATNIRDAIDKNFCVVTMSSLEDGLRDDWNGLLNTIDKCRFGIRIVDEAHLRLKGLLRLDSITNIKHNWYLSATLGRSDYSEDKILNRALLDADRFVGNATYDEYQNEYVNIYLQDIYYYPSAKLCNQYFKYGAKGLIRSTYYNMLLNYKGGKPLIQNIINVVKRIKTIATTGKVLILVPLIDIIKLLMTEIDKDPYFKTHSCASVYSPMSIAEKRNALENDIIISTSMSMGVGVDIADLSAVVNFDQYASAIISEQIIGRLRDRGKETYYVDICDNVKYAKTISNWGRKRRVLLPYFPGTKPDFKKFPKIIS